MNFDFCISLYLNLSSSEKGIVERHCGVNRIFICKLYVGKAFWIAVVFVTENGDSIDTTTAMKMRFKFFCCCSVIDVTDVNRSEKEENNHEVT